MKRVLINGPEKILIAIILLYSIFVTIVNPSFLSLMTLFDIIRSASCTMVVAMGLLVVMLSGGIDVSFMSVALFGGYVSTLLMMQTGINNIAFPFIVSTLIGIALGLCNALLVHWLRLPAFIITLGTQNLFHGIMTTFISDSTIGSGILPSSLGRFGSAAILQFETESGLMRPR